MLLKIQTLFNHLLLIILTKFFYIMTTIVNAPETTVEEQQGATQVAPTLPTDIFVSFDNEAVKTQNAAAQFNVFETIKLVNDVKSKINVLHESLKQRSNIYIFGAGGTTSWFLPKLLKIYNDAFNKVSDLRYDLNIVLIDADIV